MPPETLDNGVREEVFSTLLEASGPLSPSEIADEIGVDRELASYHLKILLNVGLVIREDDGKYYPQPLLTDPDFGEEIEEVIRDLISEAEERVFVSPDADISPESAVVNTVRAGVSLHLFDGKEDSADSR